MHVFVTGATGLIGSAVVAELLGNSHTVLALARSDASTLAAEAAGAETLRGGLADLDSLRAPALPKPRESSTWLSATTSAAPTPSRGRSPRRVPPWRPWAKSSSAVTALWWTVSGTPPVPGTSLHRGRPATDRRGPLEVEPARSRRSWTWPPTRSSQQRCSHATYGPQRGEGRICRHVDRDRTPNRRVGLPGRRHPALAGRARARRGRPLQAGPGAGARRNLLARRGRRGRRGT